MTVFLYGTMLLLTILIMVYLFRVIKGPTVFDRLLGLNGIGTKAILLLVVIGTIYGRLEMFVDISTGYALLNLVSAVGVTKYLEHTGASS